MAAGDGLGLGLGAGLGSDGRQGASQVTPRSVLVYTKPPPPAANRLASCATATALQPRSGAPPQAAHVAPASLDAYSRPVPVAGVGGSAGAGPSSPSGWGSSTMAVSLRWNSEASMKAPSAEQARAVPWGSVRSLCDQALLEELRKGGWARGIWICLCVFVWRGMGCTAPG